MTDAQVLTEAHQVIARIKADQRNASDRRLYVRAHEALAFLTSLMTDLYIEVPE